MQRKPNPKALTAATLLMLGAAAAEITRIVKGWPRGNLMAFESHVYSGIVATVLIGTTVLLWACRRIPTLRRTAWLMSFLVPIVMLSTSNTTAITGGSKAWLMLVATVIVVPLLFFAWTRASDETSDRYRAEWPST